MTVHKPVLLKKSIDLLNVKSGIFVDCTLGGGGHTLKIISKLKTSVSAKASSLKLRRPSASTDKQNSKLSKVICFDIDKEAIEKFKNLLIKKGWKGKDSNYSKDDIEVFLLNKNFSTLKNSLEDLEIECVDGIIADLGASSDQIEDAEKGFSYTKDGPLDMRMDKRLKVSAADLINGLYEKELIKLFRVSDERYARRIAQAIVKERKIKPICSTLHLVKLIKKVLPLPSKGKRADKPVVGAYWQKPVMRVFQSLRIAVNSELSSLQKMLPQVIETLATGSRFVVISFHSGEDRIIKNFFREKEKQGKIKILTKKPIRPESDEIIRNPRARSAKLRAIENSKTGKQ